MKVRLFLRGKPLIRSFDRSDIEGQLCRKCQLIFKKLLDFIRKRV